MLTHVRQLAMQYLFDYGKIFYYANFLLVGADGHSLPVSLQRASDGLFEAEWLPRAAGELRLAVLVADQHIRGSPFLLPVIDLSAVRVIGLKHDRVGVEQKFNGKFINNVYSLTVAFHGLTINILKFPLYEFKILHSS